MHAQTEEAASTIKGFKATISRYEAIVESLKSSSREVALNIVNALRNDATLDEVVEYCEKTASARKASRHQNLRSPSQESEISALQTRLAEFEGYLQDLQASPPEMVIEQLRMVSQPPRFGLSVKFSPGSILNYNKDKDHCRGNQRYLDSPVQACPDLVELCYTDYFRVERKADMNFLLNPVVEVPKGSEYETWTSIIDDSAVVHYLLDVYFTWFHPLSPVFSEALFRQDMVQGKNQYCSRVLVNAILSLACYLPGQRGAGWLTKIKNETAVEFLKEAEKLFYDAPEPCLTNIAALTIMSAVEIQRCRFGPAWMFSRQASSMAMYLGLNQRAHNTGSWEELDLCWTFWTVFQLDQLVDASKFPNRTYNCNAGSPRPSLDAALQSFFIMSGLLSRLTTHGRKRVSGRPKSFRQKYLGPAPACRVDTCILRPNYRGL